MDCIQLAQSWSPTVGFYEYDYEPVGSIKAGHLLKFTVFWAVMLRSLAMFQGNLLPTFVSSTFSMATLSHSRKP